MYVLPIYKNVKGFIKPQTVKSWINFTSTFCINKLRSFALPTIIYNFVCACVFVCVCGVFPFVSVNLCTHFARYVVCFNSLNIIPSIQPTTDQHLNGNVQGMTNDLFVCLFIYLCLSVCLCSNDNRLSYCLCVSSFCVLCLYFCCLFVLISNCKTGENRQV